MDTDFATPCCFCGVAKDIHLAQEKVGDKQHRWSQDSSNMVVVDRETAQTPSAPGTNVILAPQPDLALRRLLVDRGVLTEGDLEILRKVTG